MEFTAVVHATGGRSGTVRNESGTLDVSTTPPGSNRPGVTPEELLAAGWGACFGGAYAFEARQAGINPTPRFRVEVTLSVDDGTYLISRAELVVEDPEPTDPQVLAVVTELAHARCPVSKAFASGVGELTVRASAAAP